MEQMVARPVRASKQQLRNAFAGLVDVVALDSSGGPEDLARYSIFATSPRAVFTVLDDRWRLVGRVPGPLPAPSATPLAALDHALASTAQSVEGIGDNGDAGPGWIGFFGYDAAPLFEKLTFRHPRDTLLPDIWLAYFDSLVVYDEWTHRCDYRARLFPGDDRSATISRMDEVIRAIEAAPGDGLPDDGRPLVAAAPTSEIPFNAYLASVRRAIEYIRAGDIFQVNLSQRFCAPVAGPVDALYQRLTMQTKAPYSALLRTPDWSILSSSPELFFRADPNGRLETRPIKGTRPRGVNAAADQRLANELLASPKDLAELTMIVDLERNDLGRVCDYGTIRVERHAGLESYSNVHHLVATVAGQLRKPTAPSALLRALFPGGSITGAPKIRAMQIIDELEPRRRGVYTGAIGYFGDNGRSEFNIAIRTAVVERGQVHFHVGGGIVADSEPEAEYQETIAKAAGLQRVLMGWSAHLRADVPAPGG